MPNNNNGLQDIINALSDIEQTAETNSIGKMIASGIGVGIEQNSYLSKTGVKQYIINTTIEVEKQQNQYSQYGNYQQYSSYGNYQQQQVENNYDDDNYYGSYGGGNNDFGI